MMWVFPEAASAGAPSCWSRMWRHRAAGPGFHGSWTCLGRVVPAVQQRARVEAMEALYCMPAQYGVVVHRIKMCPSIAIVIARSRGIMTMLVRTKRLRKR